MKRCSLIFLYDLPYNYNTEIMQQLNNRKHLMLCSKSASSWLLIYSIHLVF